MAHFHFFYGWATGCPDYELRSVFSMLLFLVKLKMKIVDLCLWCGLEVVLLLCWMDLIQCL